MSDTIDRPTDMPPEVEGLLSNAPKETVREYVEAWWQRVKAGDLGSLPIIIGLILIALVFGIQDPNFFNDRNFVNLILQMSGIATIGIGVVFVLLIAEIDLSVAFVSGVGGVVMTLLLRPGDPGWPWPIAIGAALIVCAVIGLIHGLIVTKASVPSFVVTLAGLLAYSGVVLILTTQASEAGTIVIQNRFVVGIANNFMTDIWGWVLGAVVVGGYALLEVSKVRSRIKNNLPHKPMTLVWLQTAGLGAIVAFAVFYANQDRGVPMVALLLLVLIVSWSFIASRTRFGRHVYAIGGNPEAARRAGINVDRVKISVFVICSTMAGVGGIILASRLRSVDTNTGGGNLLLQAIAAAVIGGTSLFGGHGRVVSALLGALVVMSVDNGMGLLLLPSGVKFVVTGLVLLAAVLVDSFAKRRSAASGIG